MHVNDAVAFTLLIVRWCNYQTDVETDTQSD